MTLKVKPNVGEQTTAPVKKIFVVFSHTLTQDQIEDFKLNYGEFVGDLNYPNEQFDSRAYEAEIVTLKEVDPLLQNQVSNIDPNANLYAIQNLAASIVVEAVKAEATHFYIAGEPTLVMWANLYAKGLASYDYNSLPHSILGSGYDWVKVGETRYTPNMVCVQSTTKRVSTEIPQPDGTVLKTAVFKHVQWREIF